jgi:NADPH:quinone reductase-like Zn-dependent oxidoreductase
MSETMRAVRQDALGGPEVLALREVEKPGASIGQVLVQVHASSVNPADIMNRQTGIFSGQPPFVLGWDVSGVIAEVGPGVTIFRPGDEVMGLLPFPRGGGAYAEYAVAPARTFVRKPALLSHVEAAALPLAGLTAWQALVETAGVDAGSRVVITGAAGGVGHLAVQIAHARGAHVIAVASAAQGEYLRDLGADEVIDYRATDFASAISGADVVFDVIGNEYPQRAVQTVKRGGIVVTTLPQSLAAAVPAATGAGVRLAGLFVESDRMGMTALAGLVESGMLRPTIAATYPLADAATAQSTKHGSGKVVLTVA